MPFPKLQSMPIAMASGTTNILVSTFDENTRLETVVSKDFHEKLPPPEMFDLETLLKNKVPLEYTKTQLLNRNTLTIHETPKTETKTQEKGEVNNEK